MSDEAERIIEMNETDSKQIAQTAEQKAVMENAAAYLIAYKSGFQRAAKRQKEVVAAMAEYIRIYPASENHVRFSAAAADYAERLLSKFLTTAVSPGYDPDIDNFSEKAPLTIYDLKEYVNGKFSDCELQVRREEETKPDVDRFVRVCGVLKQSVRVSADDQSLFFLYSTCFLKGLELLKEPQIRIEKYFSANEQERMERSFREVFELSNVLYSALGFPSGLGRENCGIPVFLKRLQGVLPADRWFRALFDGDRDHAVFNPEYIAGCHSMVANIHNKMKSVSDRDDHFTLVRDVFSGKSLYQQLLLSEEYFANYLTNKYKADEALERVNARVLLIRVIMNGVFEREWERIRRECEELLGRMNSDLDLSEEEKRKCEVRLNSLREARQKILNEIDKAGYKLEDLLRGEIEVEKGRFVKVRQLSNVGGFNAVTGASPGKQIESDTKESVTNGPPHETSDQFDVEVKGKAHSMPVKKAGRGRSSRISDKFCHGSLKGDGDAGGGIRVTSEGQEIFWHGQQQKVQSCKLTSRPAVQLFEELMCNCVEAIQEKKQPETLYVTSELWRRFKKGLQAKNSTCGGQLCVKNFLREVVQKGTRIKCKNINQSSGRLYLDPVLENGIDRPKEVNYVYPLSLNATLAAKWVVEGKKKD